MGTQRKASGWLTALSNGLRNCFRQESNWWLLGGLSLLGLIVYLVMDCAGGTTVHFRGTVVNRQYYPAYTSLSVHTTGGKHPTTYITHDYHPPRWEADVHTEDGTETLSVSEDWYNTLVIGTSVPLQRQVGRYTGWHYHASLDSNFN